VPWFQGPKEQVAAIQASIAAHDPASKKAAPVDVPPAPAATATAVLDRPAAAMPAQAPPVERSALSALLASTENEPRTDADR
jgi:hypothetical protein